METKALYRIAAEENIEVLSFPLEETGSMSVMDGGRCFIGMDDSVMDSGPKERVHLSHELGHCLTGSFYNRYAAVDCRQRHENRANKWAIRKLISAGQLDDAVAEGCVTLWDLAEHFQVTEQFMKKAVCLYTYGNVAAELYF